MSDPIVLVDCMNLVFRSHFAHAQLSAGDKPTGVQYGILKTIRDLRENVSKRIVFVWDHGIPVLGAERPRNWRDDMMSGYKASRKPNSAYAEIIPQLAPLHRVICQMGYQHASVMGLEADDVIGLLAKSAWKNDVKLVFSTDRDFYQLLAHDVHVLTPKKDKGQFSYVRQSDVERDYGISVDRWAEYLALGGDKSDSIKPLRGMGPKTALKLVQMGINPGLPYNEQPELFRNASKAPAYEEVWEMVQKCYSAARIPTSWNDPRIKSCLNADALARHIPSPDQSWRDDETKAKAFREVLGFMADRNMTSLVANAKSFFNMESKPSWHNANSPKVTNDVPKPKVLRRPINRLL